MTSSHTTIIFIKNSDLTNFYTVDGIIIIIGVGWFIFSGFALSVIQHSPSTCFWWCLLHETGAGKATVM